MLEKEISEIPEESGETCKSDFLEYYLVRPNQNIETFLLQYLLPNIF